MCAQLAEAESPAPGATFLRKAAPDAGVECYWRLADGAAWAWQAKFSESMGDAQWQQIDKSVQTAIEKHSRLVMYFVCFPLDFADPRIEHREFAADRWERHVARWEVWAQARGMRVRFVHWGEHELATRLMRDENRGRILYWFGKQLFSREWFEDRLEEAVANADQRYLPELNVDLSMQDIFDGLGRTSEFFDRLKVMQGKVRRAHEKLSQEDLEGPRA